MELSESNLDISETEFTRNKCGIYEFNEYTSPEEYHDREFNKKNLSERDIWGCGVLLFKLLTGSFPFTDDNGKVAPNKIKNATYSFPQLRPLRIHSDTIKDIHFGSSFSTDFVSSEWKELLKRMISFQQQRITMKQLISHPLKQHYF